MFLPRFFLPVPLFALLCSPLAAQLRQSQVNEPSGSARLREELRRASETAVKSDEILIPALRGLAIVPDAATAAGPAGKPVEGISCHGLAEAQEARIRKSLQRWINRPVTLDSLDRMARAAEKAASLQVGSLMTATYPPQEITGGHIVMVLNVPLLNDLSFAGSPRFGAGFLSRAVLTRPGGTASAESIRKDLDFLNRNPFRRATALWSPAPGDVPAANLIIHIREKRPWNIFTGFDNYASEALGDERLYLGGKFGNVLGLDHRLGWLLLGTADGESLHAGSLSYEVPLPRHRIMTFSTGFSESSTTTPTTLVDNNGEFFNIRGMLETPLPDWKNLRHQWKTGFSFRDNGYRNGAAVTDLTIFQIENLWEGELHDRRGHTAFSAGLLWNPGEDFISSDDAVYRSFGATDSDSWVAVFKADRTVALDRFGNLALAAEAQWTDENLIPSNQYAGGGAQRIRGYDEGEVFFDKALFMSAEWQFPRIRLPSKASLRPHLFIDGGWLGDHGADSELLSSLGIGVQCLWRDRVSASLQLAQPLRRFNGSDRDPVFYFSLNTFW